MKEELIETVSTQIRNCDKSIKKKSALVKTTLNQLQSLVNEQSINIDLLKENMKSKTPSKLSEILKNTPNDANSLYKTYKNLKYRNCIDKTFLENLDILDKPVLKAHKKNKINNSSLLEIGSLCGKIRNLNETRKITDQERQIMKQMLNQLEKEL